MTIDAKKGTWTADGTATQAITDVGFAPKALIIWATGPGAAGTITANSLLAIGIGTRRAGATQSRSMCLWAQDNVGTSSASTEWATSFGVLLASELAEDYSFSLDSLDSGGFTVTYSSAANASGDIWHYLALGGGDIGDANVIEDDWPTSGGFSIIGFGFKPDACIMLTGVGTAQASGAVTSGARISIGAWGSSTNETGVNWVASAYAEDGQTTAANHNDNSYFSSAAILSCLVASDTIDGFAGVSARETDGYTMGNTNAPAAAQRVFALGLKGMYGDSAAKAQATTAVADTWTGSQVGTPKVAFFARCRGVTSGTLATDAFGLLIGATDGTTQGDGMVTGVEAATTQADRVHHTDSTMREISTANPPVNVRKATFTSFAANAVTLTWDAAGGTAYQVGVLLLGNTRPIIVHNVGNLGTAVFQAVNRALSFFRGRRLASWPA